MIDRSKFLEVVEWKGKSFGRLKLPVTVSKNNIRQDFSIEEIKEVLAPSIKEFGLQQLPVANGQGEIFRLD